VRVDFPVISKIGKHTEADQNRKTVYREGKVIRSKAKASNGKGETKESLNPEADEKLTGAPELAPGEK